MEEFLPEDEATVSARHRGREVGATPIGPAGGAALRFLATLIGARTVVEIGTGCGVSGIYMMRGMPKDAVLTSVDVDHENQRLAKLAYREAGLGSYRTRMIVGRALEVLPRLTDGAYDMVFCDAVKTEYPEYLTAALRLLRPGGVVAFDNALWHQRIADPAHRGDPTTEAIREVHHLIREDERLVPLLLPVGDGLLCAVKRD
ncbi:O-methyltransferase [Actinomadura logoneensis]|uniref:O-methyltransferase n=1 Tax=Actinomadura logoneensis TaxID=2293572 RepID=A0A372JMT3_9ACTN|nr:O-methyltransferase [Actinomadura logoneensis]RFU41136.1 O-methyltransferase [Actinomadura logoneensis]